MISILYLQPLPYGVLKTDAIGPLHALPDEIIIIRSINWITISMGYMPLNL